MKSTKSTYQIVSARLLDAAPAMLKALIEVTADIEAFCNDHNSDSPTDVTICLPRLRAAIHKAEWGE